LKPIAPRSRRSRPSFRLSPIAARNRNAPLPAGSRGRRSFPTDPLTPHAGLPDCERDLTARGTSCPKIRNSGSRRAPDRLFSLDILDETLRPDDRKTPDLRPRKRFLEPQRAIVQAGICSTTRQSRLMTRWDGSH
jgi:hypothetical protein